VLLRPHTALKFNNVPRRTPRHASSQLTTSQWKPTTTTAINQHPQDAAAQCESKHFTPQKFSGNISSMTEYFKIKFYTHTARSCYAKLLHFIQLFLTMRKLCHIKHNLIENFYISVEQNTKNCRKLRYLCNGMTESIKFGMVMHDASLACVAVKNFNLKYPRWQTFHSVHPDFYRRPDFQNVLRGYRINKCHPHGILTAPDAIATVLVFPQHLSLFQRISRKIGWIFAMSISEPTSNTDATNKNLLL